MPGMKITLRLEADDEASACNWPAVQEAVRRWAAGQAASPPACSFSGPRRRELTLDLQTADLLSAIRQLHEELYDREVNFTVSVD
ncbi:MAG: hypothetical protein C4531_15890 [Desulfurivibrio sp.]|nr:MAG: hypothetical protein C4531_15890 [Desulfurivibrio sp.]